MDLSRNDSGLGVHQPEEERRSRETAADHEAEIAVEIGNDAWSH